MEVVVVFIAFPKFWPKKTRQKAGPFVLLNQLSWIGFKHWQSRAKLPDICLHGHAHKSAQNFYYL